VPTVPSPGISRFEVGARQHRSECTNDSCSINACCPGRSFQDSAVGNCRYNDNVSSCEFQCYRCFSISHPVISTPCNSAQWISTREGSACVSTIRSSEASSGNVYIPSVTASSTLSSFSHFTFRCVTFAAIKITRSSVFISSNSSPRATAASFTSVAVPFSFELSTSASFVTFITVYLNHAPAINYTSVNFPSNFLEDQSSLFLNLKSLESRNLFPKRSSILSKLDFSL
jgi:hypothetical protein